MMKMCYDGAVSMPSNYVIMNKEEMTYVEGGDARLKLRADYLKKSACKSVATSLNRNGKVTGMSTQGIAEEIFGHAQMWFRAALVRSLGIDNGIIDYVLKRAGYVDIANGGDVWYRKAAYTALWYGNI